MNAKPMLAGLVLLVALPIGAQTSRPPNSVQPPPDVALAGLGQDEAGTDPTALVTRLFCVDRITDQATGGCLQASSTATFGMLFPYPGVDNTFTSPAVVSGGNQNEASGNISTIGGGRWNFATGSGATVGGGEGNRAQGNCSVVAGGAINVAGTGTYSAVVGGYRNCATGLYSIVGSGRENEATAEGAAVLGGINNWATGQRSVVCAGGGFTYNGNWASGGDAFIGAGCYNRASGRGAAVVVGFRNEAIGDCAVVATGVGNVAGGAYSFVGGGGDPYNYGQFGNVAGGRASAVLAGSGNLASGDHSSVGGGGGRGLGNTASGSHSAVPGGQLNTAAGAFSFAAGRRAMANHDGTFVWGDSFDADKPSSAPDEFNVYCSGGARFFSNSAASTGVLLAPGAGSWTSVSDRNCKENVEPIDPETVLSRVLELPIATWNYQEQSDKIRHMGPMAQDFFGAFGLGLGDKTIDTVDADGVALAAIQGLHAKLKERLAEKDAEVVELQAVNEQLQRRLERLEAIVESQVTCPGR